VRLIALAAAHGPWPVRSNANGRFSRVPTHCARLPPEGGGANGADGPMGSHGTDGAQWARDRWA